MRQSFAKKKKSVSSHGQQAQGSTIESLITGTEGIAEIVKTTTAEGTTQEAHSAEGTTQEATTTEGTIQEATQNATTTEGTIQEATQEGSTPKATTKEAIPAERAPADTNRTIKTKMSKIAITEAEEITGTTASVTATVEGDATLRYPKRQRIRKSKDYDIDMTISSPTKKACGIKGWFKSTDDKCVICAQEDPQMQKPKKRVG